MKRALALLLSVLMLLASVTACGTGGANGPSQDLEKDTLTVGLTTAIDDFNPMNLIGGSQPYVFMSVFSCLFRSDLNENGKLELAPDLAERWENSEDGTTWTFYLNQNAVFSNGEPVTAEDVKFTFDELKNSAYMATKVDMVTSVEILDEYTVAIHMDEYSARTPYCWADICIVNAKLYQEDLDTYLSTLIGSGPYTLDSVDPATGNMVLVRNENYWGELPQIREISLRIISDASTQIISLESGQIDLIPSLSATSVDQIESNDALAVTAHSTDFTQQLLFNNEVAPFDNKLVRQAISYAIDWETLAMVRTKGHYAALNTLMYAPLLDVDPDGIKQYEYNPEKAKALLEQAGIETPYDLGTFLGGSGGAAELIQQYLADVGLIVQPQELEAYTFIYSLLDGDYGIAYMGSNGGYTTAAEQFAQWYKTGSSMNLANYSNPELDVMIDQLMVEKDQDKYDQLVLDILEIIAEDAPVANLSWDYYYSAHSKSLYVPACKSGFVYLPACHW